MTIFSGLMIATPCYGGVVTNAYLLSMVRTCAVLTARGLRHELVTAAGDSLVMRARNTLVSVFMASGHSHLMFIDADVEWPAEAVVALLEADKDVVCGAYPKKVMPRAYAVNFLDGPAERDPLGRIEIKEAAAGFLMIRRAVFERMMQAYPQTRYGGTAGLSDQQSQLTYALFDCLIDEDDPQRQYLSEDYGFCRRWRAIGGRIWLDPRLELRHHGATAFEGKAAELQRL
ncbi:glycosyltransferase family 2 protein [Reyranella sp. CPCC 100927]|uniref:glycosyltransferase family 2 protein n=1 Tax=Reyranella sp. CPCC 100927 TaxID=2599616 RepID=UPI0011B698A6|nr:glycosyltransferase family 2 protein [Reyranella sp. CPCC 100927]TWT15212.1 glycosyltransferase family 2 protein [Reyranella sp. CPCC 100927]